MISLNTLPEGAEARLVSLGGDRSLRRRLMELGLLTGTTVRVIRKDDLGGVMEIEVRRCRLSVRTSEAGQVFVAAA